MSHTGSMAGAPGLLSHFLDFNAFIQLCRLGWNCWWSQIELDCDIYNLGRINSTKIKEKFLFSLSILKEYKLLSISEWGCIVYSGDAMSNVSNWCWQNCYFEPCSHFEDFGFDWKGRFSVCLTGMINVSGGLEICRCAITSVITSTVDNVW